MDNDLLTRARTKTTLTVADTSALTGLSVQRLYEQIRATGEVCGVKVLRMGATGKAIRIPARPILRLLSLEEEE